MSRTLVRGGGFLLFTCFCFLQLAGSAYAASVTLAWDANGESYLKGYNVYRSSQSGVFTSAPLNGSSLLTVPSFNDSSAQSGLTYYYVIKAVSTDGTESAASNQIQAITPATPTALVVNAGVNQSITLPAKGTLTATASGGTLPAGTVTYRWSVVSGTGASFANASAASTQATFASAGAYTLRVTAVNGALSSSDDMMVTVSAAPPPALVSPIGLSASCSSDLKKFTVSWTTVPGADNYYLRVDHEANNANGLWIMDATDFDIDEQTATSFSGALVAGQSYKWWVHGANATAGIGPSSTSTFICNDTTAPAVSITAPAAASTVSGSTVLVSAAASDNLGVAGVQFKLNGVNLGAEVLAAPYSTSWNTANSANGSYTLSAVARDAAGSKATSALVTVTLSNGLSDPTGLAASCSSDLKKFTVSWTAVAGADNYYLRVDHEANNANGLWIIDGTDYSIDELAATSFTGTVVAGQSYTWWIHGANASAGIGPSASASFTCSDTTAPAVSITAPAAGFTTSATSLTIAASASDSVGVAGVQFMMNGAKLQAEDSTSPYSISWTTKNKANGTYSFQAVARDAAGNVTTSAPVSLTLKNGKTTRLVQMETAMATDGAAEILTTGYARAGLEEGDAAFDDVAIISVTQGDNVVSEASVRATAPVLSGRVYVDVRGSVNTGVAMANDNSEAAAVSFYFTDSTGADVAQGSFTLEAKQTITKFVNEAPFNLSGSITGSLTFSSSLPVGITALRGFTNERGDFLMTTLPVGSLGAAADGAAVVFPQFADGAGWATQVVLTNPTDAPLTGTVQFFAQTAQPGPSALPMTVNGVTDSTFPYTIAARSAIRLATGNSSSEAQVGYVLATPADHSAAPQGLLIFSFKHEGITVSEAGMPATSTGTEFRTYAETSGSIHSGLAIANPSLSPAHTTLELIQSDGTATGLTTAVDIPAGGHVARFINELFPALADGFQGTLRIASTQPVAATGLRLRLNQRGDMLITAIPVIDHTSQTSAGADDSNLLFPLVVNGGGYSTEFIRIRK